MLVGVPGNKNGIDPFLIGTPEVTVKKFAQFVDEEKYELRSSSRYSLENGNELGSRPQIGGRCGDSADGIANRVCNPKPTQPARAPCSLREHCAACESIVRCVPIASASFDQRCRISVWSCFLRPRSESWRLRMRIVRTLVSFDEFSASFLIFRFC